MNLIIISLITLLFIVLINWYKQNNNVTLIEWFKLNKAFYNVFMRGIIIPHEGGYQRWANVKDLMYTKLFKELNIKYGKTCKANAFGLTMTMILDTQLEQCILILSPKFFGPGYFKKNIFKQFMNKNLGVLVNKEWKLARIFNERILGFKKENITLLPIIKNAVDKNFKEPPKNINDFIYLAEQISYTLVLGNIPYNQIMFDIIIESQPPTSLWDIDNVSQETRNRYNKFLYKVLMNPPKGGLIERITKKDFGQHTNAWRHLNAAKHSNACPMDNYTMIKDQVLHWLFPARSIIVFTIPIFMVIMTSFPNEYQKIINELKNYTEEDIIQNKNTYFHFSILETLRLYNLVITLLRTARKNMTLNKIKFHKNEHLFMLFPYLLRSPKFFGNVNKYDPSRWQKSSLLRKYPNFPFSVGPQTCPGIDVSMTLIKVMLLKLFKYNYTLISDNKLEDINNLPFGINVYNTRFDVN